MNYYNHKILNLIVDNILNLSLDEINAIYQSFENEGVEEISESKQSLFNMMFNDDFLR